MAKNTRSVVEEIAIPIIESMGLTYVDTEYAKQGQDWQLTIYIDKEGGVQFEAVSYTHLDVYKRQELHAGLALASIYSLAREKSSPADGKKHPSSKTL